MANENIGLLGFKVGMTQIYNEDGAVVPVTVLDMSGNVVHQVKTKDSKDGYNAVQLAIGEKRKQNNQTIARSFQKTWCITKEICS